MNPADDTTPPGKGQFLVYPTEDGQTKIEVRLENETVWLTQQHMAGLFQTTQVFRTSACTCKTCTWKAN